MATYLRTRYLIFVLLPLAGSCSIGTPRESDQMCAEISRFASTIKAGESHSVVLRGGWGGDMPNILMTHDCQAFGYGPGNALCAYLVPNTSWEFGQNNAKRAAECLDSSSRQDFIRRLDKYEWPAEIASPLRTSADKDVQVTVSFETKELSILTLSAARVGN